MYGGIRRLWDGPRRRRIRRTERCFETVRDEQAGADLAIRSAGRNGVGARAMGSRQACCETGQARILLAEKGRRAKLVCEPPRGFGRAARQPDRARAGIGRSHERRWFSVFL